MAAHPTPHVQSMVLCDQAIREAGTRKYSLIGVFHVIWSDTYPVGHPRFVLYAEFSAPPGSYEMRYVLRDLSRDGRVLETFGGLHARSEDRLRPVEVTPAFREIVFEGPGRYAIEVFANDHRIGDRTFRVAHPREDPL